MSEATAALKYTEKLYAKLNRRRTFVSAMDRAYRGVHRLRFATDKWAEFHAERYENFSDNWCGVVANSPNERLSILGFRLDDDPKLSDDEKQLQRDWAMNDMESQASQGFLHTLIASRSGVLVWGDKDGNPEVTWEHAGEIVFDYDPDNQRKLVGILKSWRHDDLEYATLYWNGALYKWERPYLESTAPPVDILNPTSVAFYSDTRYGLLLPGSTSQGDWKPREVPGELWPLHNPLIEPPGVEFRNRPMLGGEPISEIQGTLAMQDAINLLWAYLFTAADFASMPARVVLGQAPPKLPILDAEGTVIGQQEVDLKKLADDRILWLTGEKTSIGQWDPANLDNFIGTIESAVTHIAAQTRTPPHYLVLGKGMVNVNAEGMKAAETGLVMKVQEEQVFFSPSVRGVNRLMALVRGNDKVAERCQTGTVQWKDAENRSQAQQVDALLKLQTIGFPFAWIAEQYGLSDTELARVLSMKESELALDPLGEISRQMGQNGPVQTATQPATPAA